MPNDAIDLDKVTPLAEWYVRAGLTPRTGRKLIASGEGPPLIILTERRRGVRERDHREWLETRRHIIPSSK